MLFQWKKDWVLTWMTWRQVGSRLPHREPRSQAGEKCVGWFWDVVGNVVLWRETTSFKSWMKTWWWACQGGCLLDVQAATFFEDSRNICTEDIAIWVWLKLFEALWSLSQLLESCTKNPWSISDSPLWFQFFWFWSVLFKSFFGIPISVSSQQGKWVSEGKYLLWPLLYSWYVWFVQIKRRSLSWSHKGPVFNEDFPAIFSLQEVNTSPSGRRRSDSFAEVGCVGLGWGGSSLLSFWRFREPVTAWHSISFLLVDLKGIGSDDVYPKSLIDQTL